MSRRVSVVVCLLFGLLLSFAPAGRGQEVLFRPKLKASDIEAGLRTYWYGVYVQGKKIGYIKSGRARTDEGIVESFLMTQKLVSFGQKTEITMNQTFVFEAKEPYRLVRGAFTQVAGPIKQVMKATRNDKGLLLHVEAGGVKMDKQLPDPDYTLADSLATEVWVRGGPKTGDRTAAKEFSLLEQKADIAKSKIVSAKTTLAGGVKTRFYEVETVDSKDLAILQRYDDEGQLLSLSLPVYELRLEPEEQAKNTEYSQDLFVFGMVKVDRPLGDTTRVKQLVLEVSGKEAAVLEDGPRQSVAQGPNGSRLLKLGKAFGKETKATPKEIEEALSETINYPISNARIKALAAKAAGDAKTPQDKLKNVINFVHEYIQPHLSANLPNIHDLLDRKKGDCKSYALMFNNLARAAGIPAREVAGLLYIGDDQKAFGGHAWNEVVLDGVWVPVDASLAQTEVDATHISFGSDRGLKNLLTTLGKLSFKVVEIEVAR